MFSGSQTNWLSCIISKKVIGTFCLLFFFNVSFSQIFLKGVITDSVTKAPVDYLLVAVFQYKTDKIVTYAFTSPTGEYKLTLPYSNGVFTLKARSLDYQEYIQDLVLSEARSKEIVLSFQVIPKINTLHEVVVEVKRPPVVIKKDTLIYDIVHWTQAGDQTLEDVLRKMPGFEVLENGELKINGKPIRKVLINGEEFLKGGAALSTRSLSPDAVQSLEVRLDEKDNKVKESLLNSGKLVVLDIKLKDELNKRIFGKARLTSGYQKQPNMGGYANLFSLGKKKKYHLLGEYDAFGQRTISLSQINNIGREAFQSIFNLPADFNRLTENQEFNKEIYGFKDYTKSRLGIVGLTSKYNLGKYLELFIGSYNSYTNDGVGGQTSQRYVETNTQFQFDEQKNNLDYVSKNKLDLEFDKDKVKANYNFNAVLGDKNFLASHNDVIGNYFYKTGKANKAQEYYHNFLVEYFVSKRVAFQVKAFYGITSKLIDFNLQHNQPAYIEYLKDEGGSLIPNFNQTTKEDKTELVTDTRLQFQNKLGSFQLGLQTLAEKREVSKKAYENNAEKTKLTHSLFSGETPQLTYGKIMPYMEHRVSVGKISINNKVGWANLQYPVLDYSHQNNSIIEYDGGLKIDFNAEDNVAFSFSQKVSAYPMLNFTKGYDLVDFQTFAIPQQLSPKPRLESVYQLNFDKVIAPINTAMEIFALFSQSKTYNSYAFTTAPFIGIDYNQLGGEYYLAGLKIASVFSNFPFNIKLEPSYLVNRSDNTNSTGSLYSTSTVRKMIQLRALSKFEKKNFNLEFKAKFSEFDFRNELAPNSTQQILLAGITYKQELLAKRVYWQTTVQQVNFWGGTAATIVSINSRAQYSLKSFACFFEGDNLLDNKYFVKQNIAPTYFTESQQFLFGRFFRVGVEYTFK